MLGYARFHDLVIPSAQELPAFLLSLVSRLHHQHVVLPVITTQ